MAVKARELIILMLLLCCIQKLAVSKKEESCFVETKVQTRVHCRFGGNGGVTEIRGFEVRLEGGPPSMSDFKCTIFELDVKLTLQQSRVTFASRFYPVTRRMPYVVVFSSLPRKDDSYLNEIHVTSKSCDTQETSADWKPSYCNVSYDSDSQILSVNFEAPPEKFNFDKFDVHIVNFGAGFEQTHHRINQTEFSVPNIQPGEYEIRIRPFDPVKNNNKLCKCRNIDGRCDTCSELYQRFTAMVTEVQKTSMSTEDKLNISTVIIPVLCVLACMGAVCVILFLRRRGVKFHLHKAVVDANPEKKPTFTIYFDENSMIQRRIADKLKTLLSCVFGENIIVEAKTVHEPQNKDKVDMQIHFIEPGVSIAEVREKIHMLNDNVEQMQDVNDKDQHGNLKARHAIVVFDAISNKEIIPNNIPCFHLMSGLPKFINHLNSLVQLSHDDIREKMQTLDFKVAYDELDDLINNLKQELDKSDTRLFVDLPVSKGASNGELAVPNQNRCLSNNSEPDSGIRSGDEFESLNSSEETMNDKVQNYRRNQEWIQAMNSQGFVPDFEYDPYNTMPYEPAKNLAWKNIGQVAGGKYTANAPKCPSEIEFLAPDPTEYSEYGEDVFFDEANHVHVAALHYPSHDRSHYQYDYNQVPNSVMYTNMHSNGKSHNANQVPPNMAGYHKMQPNGQIQNDNYAPNSMGYHTGQSRGKSQHDNHVPDSTAYYKVPSMGKGENIKIEASQTKPHSGRHRQVVNKCKEEHSSMESLMDKMADVNARYQNSLEHESVLHEEGEQTKDKLLCPDINIISAQ